MLLFTDDPVADYERYSAQQERWIQKLPVCGRCNKHIQQEDAVRIDDEYICDSCIDDMRVELSEGEDYEG